MHEVNKKMEVIYQNERNNQIVFKHIQSLNQVVNQVTGHLQKISI